MTRYLKELNERLAEFKSDCRASRWYGAIFHIQIAADIGSDIAAIEAKAAQKAYDAEQADLLAIQELNRALADGRLDDSDVPAVQRALAQLSCSATKDREISTLLSA